MTQELNPGYRLSRYCYQRGIVPINGSSGKELEQNYRCVKAPATPKAVNCLTDTVNRVARMVHGIRSMVAQIACNRGSQGR